MHSGAAHIRISGLPEPALLSSGQLAGRTGQSVTRKLKRQSESVAQSKDCCDGLPSLSATDRLTLKLLLLRRGEAQLDLERKVCKN